MVFVAALTASTPGAEAEGSFFDFLFGQTPSAARAPAPAAPVRERPRPRAQAPTMRNSAPQRRAQPAPAAPPAAVATVKPEFVVAVFGDAFAVSVARGLGDTDDADTTRQVIDESDDQTGLTATESAAWDKAIDTIRSQAGRLDAAMLLIGSNDDASLTDPQGQKQVPGSPAWRLLYGDRVAKLADQFRDKHVPLIWVGLPIVRDPKEAQLYAAINEVVQDRAVREGATFVDSWQPFADENGDFTLTGPDVNGRPMTLRWSNGWNFTRAGARKLASFVLPDLKRLRERARATRELAVVPQQNSDVFDQALSIDVNAQILREAGLPTPSAQVAATPGPVLVLTAAPLASDGRLASVVPARATPAPATGGHAGRADDFAWPSR